MYCYLHTSRHAVAVCRNCGKTVCLECCNDIREGVACSISCADEMRDSYRLKRRLMQSFGIGVPPPMPTSVPAYTFFGLILLITGIYFSLTRPGLDFLTLALAAVFFVMAGATYRRFRTACLSC